MKLQQDQILKLLDVLEKIEEKKLKIEVGNLVIYVEEEGEIEIFELTPLKEELLKEKKSFPKEDTISITAPSAGIFYRRPEPDAPPYVEVGSLVEAGDTLALIEVMKSFGPVVSPVKGRIIQITAEDGKPVEYGQTIFIIKKEE